MKNDVVSVGLRDFQVKRLEELAEEKKKPENVLKDMKKDLFSILQSGDGIKTPSTGNFFQYVAKVQNDEVYMTHGVKYKFNNITAMYIKRGELEIIYDEKKYEC